MDRIEQEINDLLEKLDEFPGEDESRRQGASRAPIQLEQRRATRAASPAPGPGRIASLLGSINPPVLMLAGAGAVIAGLVLSLAANALIWVSFGGMIVFIAAFLLSFRRTPASRGGGAAAGGPREVFWRDRYIQYESSSPSVGSRVKRLFRRR